MLQFSHACVLNNLIKILVMGHAMVYWPNFTMVYWPNMEWSKLVQDSRHHQMRTDWVMLA